MVASKNVTNEGEGAGCDGFPHSQGGLLGDKVEEKTLMTGYSYEFF